MADNAELGPIAKSFGRKTPFRDSAGVKDRSGNGINLTLYEGQLFTPHGEERYASVKSAKIRPDDVILCGYGKTGCHWVWEILSMIVKKTPKLSETGKQVAMLEMVPESMYGALPSPRVLNTHVEYHMLPEQALTQKTKLVLTTRNPKDVALSLYHHHINLPEIYNYHGTLEDGLQLFVDGKVDNGCFFEFHRSWDKVIKEHPEHDIHVVFYEDLNQNFVPTLRALARFVGVALTEDLVEEISHTAHITQMKAAFEARALSKLIRKGIVGDWQSYLTPEINEALDRKQKEILTGTIFENFRFK